MIVFIHSENVTVTKVVYRTGNIGITEKCQNARTITQKSTIDS